MRYKHIWSSMWCKNEELESGIVFRGTKLGKRQLGCAEGPILGWRNVLWIQFEESWSYMVFIWAKISNLYRIVLWRWWFELEVNFIQRQRFKSLAHGWSAHFKEIKMDATLRWTYWQSMAWLILLKLKWLIIHLNLILSLEMPYYQEGCITRCFDYVSVLK